MKKTTKIMAFLFLAGIMTTTISCSSDDGENTSGNDPIIGIWKKVSETNNGEENDLDECDLMQTTEFKTNGTVEIKNYDLEEGQCELTEIPEGFVVKWEKNSTDNYTIQVIYAGNVEDETIYITEFSNNNNQLKIIVTNNSGGETTTFTTTFIRQ